MFTSGCSPARSSPEPRSGSPRPAVETSSPGAEVPERDEREQPDEPDAGAAAEGARFISIPLRDGNELAADLFLPDGPGPFPTILIVTPYNRRYLTAALPHASLKSELFARDSYAFVVADWRGFFGSRSAKKRTRATAEDAGRDGYDIVEWIARQPWSNRKVGMWGLSAQARIQYMTAVERPPHLVCAVPIVAEYHFDHGQFFHGGVWKKGYTETAGSVGWNMAALRSHPTRDDGFWDKVNAVLPPLSRIDIPMLVVTGWYDLHVEGIIDTFKAIRTSGEGTARHSRFLVGPWTHSFVGKLKQGELEFPEAEGRSDQEARQFFDYWLRDMKTNGWEKRPPVRYYQMGSGRWLDAESWPPGDGRETTYYLGSGGSLRETPPGESGRDTFRYDPADPSPTVGGMNVSKSWDPSAPQIPDGPYDQRTRVESREDLVLYTSEPLSAPVAVAGAVRLNLHVSSDRKDTDFAVRLTDVHPDGRSMLITDGVQRMRFREPGEVRLMEPGTVYPVAVVLSVTSYRFQPGHRIRIIVTSSNDPRFEPNPNVDRPRLIGPKQLVATNSIHYGGRSQSALVLPVENR